MPVAWKVGSTFTWASAHQAMDLVRANVLAQFHVGHTGRIAAQVGAGVAAGDITSFVQAVDTSFTRKRAAWSFSARSTPVVQGRSRPARRARSPGRSCGRRARGAFRKCLATGGIGRRMAGGWSASLSHGLVASSLRASLAKVGPLEVPVSASASAAW